MFSPAPWSPLKIEKKAWRVFNTRFKAQGGYHWSLHFTTFISVKKIDINVFIIGLNLIVWVNAVLNRTVVDDSDTARTDGSPRDHT